MYHNFSYLCTNEHIINFKNKTLMNKFLRYSFVAILAMIVGSAWADEVTMKYSGTETSNMLADGSNEAATVGLDASAWSVVADKGSASNAPGLNKAGDIRLYYNASGSNTIEVKSLANATINKIALTFTDAQYSNVSVTVNGSAVTGTDGVFEINASSFVLGNGNTSNVQVRISQIVISYGSGTPIAVQPPKFSVAGGTYYEPQTVAMSCETEGAKILYTIPAGDDPVYTDDNNYSGVFYDGNPLTISRTTTIKAMAVKDGKTSSIVSATYTIKEIEEINVAKALEIINGLENGKTTADVYKVKGFVVGTPDFQRDKEEKLYGNVNFMMADEKGGTTTLTVFRAKDFENVNFTEETINRIKDGDAVVLQGKLQKYVKDEVVTPELTNGYLISVDAGSATTTTYKITVTNTEHGNITLDKYEAAAGEKVSVINMTVDEGYEMNEPTIVAANGNVVEIGGSDEEGHYLIMPASDVVISLNISKLYTITVNFDSSMGDVRGISFDSEKSPIYKAAGKNVKFNVIPNIGNKVESVTAADEDKNPITVNIAADLSYYEFEMPAKNVTITAVFSSSVEDTWTVAGTPPLTYNTWDPSDTNCDMTPNGNGEGVSSYERDNIVLEKGTSYEFKVVKNHAWGEEYPEQNYVIKVDETALYHVKIFFNTTTHEITYEKAKMGEAGPVEHTWSVIGDLVGNWDTDTDMTKGEDGLYIAKFENVAAGTYKFKVRADHNWNECYGGGDDKDGNSVINVESDGSTVIITFDADNKVVKATVQASSGITAVMAAQQNGAIYNLAGQKVGADYKGLVIKNGRKYIQK